MIDERIPVTILSGFLGAGKTTLLNRILKEEHGLRIAVIENEFGDIGIDDKLIDSSKEDIFEMRNGCICCSLKDELDGTLGELAKRKKDFDYLIVELTGVANPKSLISFFHSNPSAVEHFKLDGVLTIIDSSSYQIQKEKFREVQMQIGVASHVIINKIDIAEEKVVEEILEDVLRINPLAKISKTIRSEIEIKDILNSSAFSLENFGLEVQKYKFSLGEGVFNTMLKDSNLKHEGILSAGIRLEGSLDIEKLDFWFRMLLEYKGDKIARIKGILDIGREQSIVFQSVYKNSEWMPGPFWSDIEKRENMIVFIGEDIDRDDLLESLKLCLEKRE